MALRNPRQDPRRQRLEQLVKLEALKNTEKVIFKDPNLNVITNPEPAPASTISIKKSNKTQSIISDKVEKVAE